MGIQDARCQDEPGWNTQEEVTLGSIGWERVSSRTWE